MNSASVAAAFSPKAAQVQEQRLTGTLVQEMTTIFQEDLMFTIVEAPNKVEEEDTYHIEGCFR